MSVFFGVSTTVAKVFIAVLAFALMFLFIAQKGKYVQWSMKDLHATGFFFLLWHTAAMMMGLMYGYNTKYVLINVFALSPFFIILLIPMRGNIERFIDIVFMYSFASAVLGLIEVFFWQDIPFIKHFVDASVLAKEEHTLNSDLFRDGSIKAFGMFSNALQNGIFMVLGVGVALFKIREEKKRRYWMMLIVFLSAIYFTYTRNVYLNLAAITLFFMIVTALKKRSFSLLWFSTLGLYAGVIAYTVTFHSFGGTFSEGDSLMARVYSWGRILGDYFLSSESMVNVIFGYGISQLSGEYAPLTSFWAIDNSLLLVFLGSGMLGVALFLVWVMHSSRYLHKQLLELRQRREIQTYQITLVFLFVYLLSGAMNANMFNTQLLFPLMMLLSSCFRFGNSRQKF